MSKKRRTSEQWQRLVDGYPHSGLTVSQYCQSQSITQSSFYLWRKKLNSSAKGKPARTQAVESVPDNSWIDLTPTIADRNAHWDVEVSLPHGVTLRMRTH